MLRRTLTLWLLLLPLAAGTLLAQDGSPAGAVPVERLAARRAALLRRMGTGVAVLRSFDEHAAEDETYQQDSDFRQDNDFFYLTGLETSNSWLVLVANDTLPARVILYLPPRDSVAERWTGPMLVPGPRASALTGIDDVRPSTNAEREIRQLVLGGGSPARRGALYFKRRERERGMEVFVDLAFGGGVRTEDLTGIIGAMRQIKDADEIARMRRAVAISEDGHLATWRIARPDILERDLEAEAEVTFRRGGAERLGYPSIVGAGWNGTTLHYDENRGTARDGDLIVMDMAAEYGYQTADLTRTIPANGRFTPRQRRIYDLVLGSQQAAMDSIRPGITLQRLDQISRTFMRVNSGDLCAPVTCDTYYIHGLAHWLGMDVHDAGSYGIALAPGMIFTVEPGIYIPAESLGVRIEDDVLVTTTGYELLSSRLPRRADEVERYMAQSRQPVAVPAGRRRD